MSTPKNYWNSSQFIFGLLIIIVGVLFTLHNLDIINAHDYLKYWPVLLLVWGVKKMIFPESYSSRLTGFLFVFFGAGFLLHNLELFEFHLHDWWPAILIVLGVSMVFKVHQGRKYMQGHMKSVSEDSDSIINIAAIMSGYERKNSSQNFRGGEIRAIMGGCELDLTQAAIKESEAVIDVFAFWGGISIKVPQTWNVIVRGTPIMGGIEDTSCAPQEGSQQKLIITGAVIMGGVEISN
jgi:predicted membrane protein